MITLEIENKLREIYPIDFVEFLLDSSKEKIDITIEGDNIIISGKEKLLFI